MCMIFVSFPILNDDFLKGKNKALLSVLCNSKALNEHSLSSSVRRALNIKLSFHYLQNIIIVGQILGEKLFSMKELK